MTIVNYKQSDQLWMGGAMIVSAFLCDLLLFWLRPSVNIPARLRLFAFAAPILFFGTYFASLLATEGTRWSIHLWSGSIILTGLMGLLLSYLIAPPAFPRGVEMME